MSACRLRRVSRGRETGASLIAGGLATLVCYVVVVWTAVFWNDDSSQICGEAANTHRDNFFPPYTVCGSGDTAYRATSDTASLTGAALFVVGVGMVLIGIALVIRGSRRAPGRRRF
jgi:hypothetical protein